MDIEAFERVEFVRAVSLAEHNEKSEEEPDGLDFLYSDGWEERADGIIGPVTSTKLAADFVAHRKRAVDHAADLNKAGEDGAWFLKLYDEWAAAFTLAAGAGVVQFH